MFVGHYGLALAAKRVAPRASLGTLFLAAQLVDLVWPMFLLAGIERVAIIPLVEALLFGVGSALYAGVTKAVDRTGRYAFLALVAFLAIIYFANAYSPPPPDVNAIAWASLAAWVFPLFGWWVDRHRAPVPA